MIMGLSMGNRASLVRRHKTQKIHIAVTEKTSKFMMHIRFVNSTYQVLPLVELLLCSN